MDFANSMNQTIGKFKDKPKKRAKRKKKSLGRAFDKNSIRYCNSCEKSTVWFYDNKIGHSRCEECGMHGTSSCRKVEGVEVEE